MRAAAAKYMIFWLHWLMEGLLQGDPEKPEHLKCLIQHGTSLGLTFCFTESLNKAYYIECIGKL